MSDFLERNGLQTVAQHFKDLFLASVHRDGAEELLERLENETDFFEAPAGAKHHGAFPGGLVIHSLNVYRRLREITIRDLTPRDALGPAPISEREEETVAILGLLHDVCKAGVYHIERKRRRNQETGVWEDYLGYTFRDPLPLGHGEKSLYQIARFIRLEDHEALAIRWHMGAYDTAVPTMRRSRRPRGWIPPPPPGISRAAATSWACIWPSMAASKRPPWPTTWARAAREAHGTAGSPPPTTPRQSRRPWKHGNVR